MKTLIYFLGTILISLQGCTQNMSQKNSSMQNQKDTMVTMTEKEWKQKLSPEQFFILREKGTEAPFSGKFYLHKEKGVYKCAACGNELFTDDMKFESHCGWPSFDREIAGGKIKQTTDNTHGMQRTEITCAKCGGHLGHIFNDGPTETGMRYCVNSLSLSFESANKKEVVSTYDTATLGGGCFWCIEAVFDDLKGVQTAVSGYSGGSVKNPSYKDVCTGETGHAEVVQVVFDKSVTSYEKILEVFFTVHDPTTLNRQGADAGTQYRSVIFYHHDEQKQIAQKIIQTLNKEKVFPNPIVTEVAPYKTFYGAENYHQEYYALNKQEPYCQYVIKPKLDKFYKVFKQYTK